MLDRRPEPVVLEHLEEVVDADKGALLGEGEIDRIERRQDAERDEEQRVEADEQPRPCGPARARRSCALARSGRRQQQQRYSRSCSPRLQARTDSRDSHGRFLIRFAGEAGMSPSAQR